MKTQQPQTPQAYLVAYTSDGNMQYRTYDYSEVYRFKKICKENNIMYSVHFRQPPTEVKERKSYIRNPWAAIRSIFS